MHAEQQLERRNHFIRQTFGRYLNSEVVDRLLDSPRGLDLGGDKAGSSRRVVVVPVRGLRAFSELCFRLGGGSTSDPYDASYARVIGRSDCHESAWLLHSTSLSPQDQRVVDRLLVQFGERAG